MGRELAEEYPTGGFEPFGDRGVLVGSVAGQDLRMRGGRNALDIGFVASVSSSMRFSEATAMATSVVCRPLVRERSASPITRL
jgi:hypothetical protein